jgi:hypothetical protein
MSLTELFIACVVVAGALLRIRALRVRVYERLDHFAGRLQSKLGPMTPAQLVKRAVRAAERAATSTHTGMVFPNVFDVGVAARDLNSWGPLGDNLDAQVVEALAARAEDNDFAFAGNAPPKVTIRLDPNARSHRPRFNASLERLPAAAKPGAARSSVGRPTPPMRESHAGRPTSYSPSDRVTALRGLDWQPTRRMCVLEFLDRGRTFLEAQCQEGTHCGGRHQRCEIRLDHPTVSEFHFELAVSRHEVCIRDLDSTNGTMVKGKLADRPIVLRDGDVVKLSGEVTMRVVRGAQERRAA